MRGICALPLLATGLSCGLVESGCTRLPPPDPGAPTVATVAAPASVTVSAPAPAPSAALSPVTSATAGANAAASSSRAPRAPVTPTWRGDHCTSDADCGWDDPCMPVRCGKAAKGVSPACDESSPAPGTCTCVEQMCTLRPKNLSYADSADVSCVDDKDCAVDVATAKCHPHGRTLIGPIHRQGPVCVCRPGMGRCVLQWQEPVPCESWRDCSWVRLPRLRPVPAKQIPRPVTRPVRPCKDGEIDSVCEPDGARKTCTIVGWSC